MNRIIKLMLLTRAFSIADGQSTLQAETWATSAAVEIGGAYRTASDYGASR
jgi:hypothetical protein